MKVKDFIDLMAMNKSSIINITLQRENKVSIGLVYDMADKRLIYENAILKFAECEIRSLESFIDTTREGFPDINPIKFYITVDENDKNIKQDINV